MKNGRRTKRRLFTAILLLCGAVSAAIEIPKASGKALGVTKGKSFSNGLVFVNGRYLEPPYVVERWGVGIRINKVPVIGQVVDWTDFLKTQPGLKIIKTESELPQVEVPVAKDEPAPAPVKPVQKQEEDVDEFDPSVEDLFEDEPQPKREKADAKKLPAKPVAVKPTPKKAPTSTYVLEGDFASNDASNALLKKVNDKRTQVNARLLDGDILYFSGRGECIPCGRLTESFLDDLAKFMKESPDADEFISRVRSAGYIVLSDSMCKRIYRNRIDYLKLQEHLKRFREETKVQQKLNELGSASRL